MLNVVNNRYFYYLMGLSYEISMIGAHKSG
jgi:hypothetical protein